MQLKASLNSSAEHRSDTDRPVNNQYNQWNQLHNSPTNPVDDNIPQHYNSPAYINQQPYTIKQQVIISEQKPQGYWRRFCEGSLEQSARNNFIKKVYMVLGLQLMITAGMCFLSYYSEGFLNFQINSYWLMWVSLGLMIASEIAIFCCQAGRQYPFNMLLLLVFTLAEAYMVSFITSIVAHVQGGAIVIVAACMTLFVVICLTLYAIFTPNDFTYGWGILISIVASLVMFGIFAWIAWIPVLHSLYCALGCIIFGIYLVIDTQLIVGGGRYELSLDDYVAGALLLYIDIIQIFLYILSLLGGK